MPKTAPNKRAKSSAAAAKKTKTNTASNEAPKKLPNVWQLSRQSILTIWRYRAIFAGIMLIYGILNFAIVQGFTSGINVSSLKNQLNNTTHSQPLSSGLSVFGVMLSSFGTSGTGNTGAISVELMLLCLVSLALIWSIRQVLNGNPVRVRDSFYKGMYPLVQFIILALFIGIELLPMIVGIGVYVTAVNGIVAVTVLEKALFVIIMLGLTFVSLYLISNSVMALYIVTLPDMSPLKALRSAKNLINARRWPVLSRILFLPVVLFIIAAIIMLPFIIFAASTAAWVFLILTLFLLTFFHSYLFNLYRELLE